jgi:FkbM family methyltransferase
MTAPASRFGAFLGYVRNRFHPLWKIRRTPWLHAVLSRVDFPVRAPTPGLPAGMSVYCYRDFAWLASHAAKEPEVQKALTSFAFLATGAAFWDVGANLGYYSWLVHAQASPRQVLLIEPLPENLRLLRRTVRRNRLPGVAIAPCAVADAAGQARLRVDRQSGATSQLDHLFRESAETAISRAYGLKATITVDARTLDSLLVDWPMPPALIKIDVEDAEALVLRGAVQILSSVRPVIVLECFKGEALEILRQHGYRLRRIDAASNFLAYPGEREPDFRAVLAQVGGTEI